MLLINYTPGIDRFSDVFSAFVGEFMFDKLKKKYIYTGVHICISCRHTVQINRFYACNSFCCKILCTQKSFYKGLCLGSNVNISKILT
jgi:hypothetical protein